MSTNNWVQKSALSTNESGTEGASRRRGGRGSVTSRRGHLAIMLGVDVPQAIENLSRWRAIVSTDVAGAPVVRGVPHVCVAAVHEIHDAWLV